MKEYEAHVRKKNGAADPVSISNMVADSILAELVNSTANDLFGVCDSYLYLFIYLLIYLFIYLLSQLS